MSSRSTRARGLLDRYRVDRRLPPWTRASYERTMRLRMIDRIQRRLAAARPVIGRGSSHSTVARLGGRRIVTSGPPERPMSEIALDVASEVSEALDSGGIETFLVERVAERVVLGVPLHARESVLACLAPLGHEPGWFVEWHDRGRTGILGLRRLEDSSHVRHARKLTIFRSLAVGGRATGPELGVDVTFWIPGTSGQLERVGERGQERFDERSVPTTESVGGRAFPSRSAFLVGRSLDHLDEPIDIVYTWVDGGDPGWLDSFRRAATAAGREFDDESLDPARYRSRDELKYSLRSVWLYCGWVRNIYLVTAGQRPSWLADGCGVTVVDHSDIFPASALPTFNSHAIEATLHRIDGLSERFIYFNDDMLVTKPLRPETFFHPNGLPYWFPSDARVPGVEDAETLAVDTAALRGRELLLERFGRAVTHKPMHSPYPLLRSVMFEIEEEFADVVDATRHSRFRSSSDLSVAASFAQHYGYASGRGVASTIATEYVHVESGRLGLHLDRIRLDPDLQTCCVNETSQRAGGLADRERVIGEFFEERFPIPAPWERR